MKLPATPVEWFPAADVRVQFVIRWRTENDCGTGRIRLGPTTESNDTVAQPNDEITGVQFSRARLPTASTDVGAASAEFGFGATTCCCGEASNRSRSPRSRPAGAPKSSPRATVVAFAVANAAVTSAGAASGPQPPRDGILIDTAETGSPQSARFPPGAAPLPGDLRPGRREDHSRHRRLRQDTLSSRKRSSTPNVGALQLGDPLPADGGVPQLVHRGGPHTSSSCGPGSGSRHRCRRAPSPARRGLRRLGCP